MFAFNAGAGFSFAIPPLRVLLYKQLTTTSHNSGEAGGMLRDTGGQGLSVPENGVRSLRLFAGVGLTLIPNLIFLLLFRIFDSN